MKKYEINNIFDVLSRQKNNIKTAYKYRDEVIKYNELYLKALHIAGHINTEVEIIGLFFENSIDYIAAFFAVLYRGKTILPININTHISEIENMLLNTGIDLILTNSEHIKEIVCLKTHILNINLLEKTQMIQATTENKNEVAIIFPTSGTMGLYKFVQITHMNLISNFLNMFKIYGLKDYERGLALLPFTTAFSLSVDLLPAMWAGMSLTIYDGGFSRNKCLSILERDSIDYIILVPSLFRLIFKNTENKKNILNNVKRISLGGEKIAGKELIDFCRRYPSIVVIQGYGMTEASPVISTTTYEDYMCKVGSVGKPLDDVQVKVIDRLGNELPDNKEGMISVTGPNIMKGYLNQKTEIIQNGWLETGDIGYIDKDGYLYITGRVKNVIIVGGRNVFPEEIESVIMQSEIVDDVKVYGNTNAIHGEIVVADIVFKPCMGNRGDAINEIKKHCRKFLANYKIPKKFEIKEEIKKTITNKIKR